MPTDFDWTAAYADKVRTPAQAAAVVNSGDSVMCGLPEPTAFLEALGERTELDSVTAFVPAPRRGGVAVARNPGIAVQAAFFSQILREAGAEAEIVPLRLQDWAGYARRNPPRVAVVQVATPSPDGTVCPGSALAGNAGMVLGDRRPDDVVFGLVNPVVPHVPGDAFHVDDFDGLIEIPSHGATPVFDERTPPDSLEPFIGALDELIPDGATLQSGVGGLTEVALSALTHKRDLGIHTEIMCQGLLDLMRSGAANGSKKTIYPNQTIFSIALPETFAFIDGNDDCRITHAELALDPKVIAQNRDMRCVNGAIEVDLWGQANAEMINGVQFSGVGGQLDFLHGCQMSDDALSIHLMQATASGGSRSRIVPRINTNAVTATRYDTQVVVTEFGIAWLKDASMRQKAERLIAVAHPDHQAELTEAAQKNGLL
ncbi:MAG: acetyl-CoA hydrolase/transferase C-terminal domain-containing protein [Actinomycetota bacterium]|jgi:acyl-CoA hydrolase|nr:acetyl-CoA hydrolase/transferase C-terminal domain-containing protein [Actinomycetota bacterium]